MTSQLFSPLPTLTGAAVETARDVPKDPILRDRIITAVAEHIRQLPPSFYWNRTVLESLATEILQKLELSHTFLAWTMIQFGSEYWRERVTGIPFTRRVLLLPHCMRNHTVCRGHFVADGLVCQHCGGCELDPLLSHAKELGYHVLIAEGTPVVMKWILSGKADAILGVGCIPSLEKAFDKLQFAGIPAMAVPLNASLCQDSTTDIARVREMIDTPYVHVPSRTPIQKHLYLLRAAASLFDSTTLAARVKSLDMATIPLAGVTNIHHTELVGLDFVSQGGKFLRPFLTLAVYDSMTDCAQTWFDQSDIPQPSEMTGAAVATMFPESVQQVATAIEVFHKASLIHDDIEDEDVFRYGKPTLHTTHGTATAINVGDFLLGLGYRLLAATKTSAAVEIMADVMSKMAQAHTKLAAGQGADLCRNHKVPLTPSEVLAIYALKTAPAFEAALYSGVRLAVSAEETAKLEQPLATFARLMGVAFQIKNDLADWESDPENKRTYGTDVQGARPTILNAFAQEMIAGTGIPSKYDRNTNKNTVENIEGNTSGNTDENIVEDVRALYTRFGIFEKTQRLADKYLERAKEHLQTIPVEPLRSFLRHLLEHL